MGGKASLYRRTGFDCEYLLNANCDFSTIHNHAIMKSTKVRNPRRFLCQFVYRAHARIPYARACAKVHIAHALIIINRRML